MNEEVKRIDLAWSDKMSYYEDRMYAFQRLWEIEEYIRECDEILGEVGLGIGFVSKANEIELLSEERSVLWSYISRLQSYHEYNIDNPLYKFFVNGATETISKIKLENFEVDNDLGLTVEYYPAMAGYSATIEKDKLTFEDFIGTLDGKADQIGIHTQFANGSIADFAVIFEQQYQSMLESGMLGENSEMTQEEFLTQFYHQGEFDHKMDKPFASFVSSVLDITIIKPLIEACTGEEWFTGEDLTDMERGLKVVFAMVDLFTLGMAAGSTKITELGAKEALEFTWKTVAVEFGSNVAVCGIGALGEAFDWPVSVTIMLSLATGITVSCIGNKLLFQNGDRVIRSVELDDAIREGDRIKIDSWEYTPSDELYLKYKNVYDNPLYYNQTTGKIYWPKDDGFREGSKINTVIAEGTIFKRYGQNSGEFLGNSTDSFEARALAPHSEGAEVHYYQLTEDYEMTAGRAAPWFGSEGGAEQFVKYKPDGSKYTIKELEDMGILEDITDLVEKGEIKID